MGAESWVRAAAACPGEAGRVSMLRAAVQQELAVKKDQGRLARRRAAVPPPDRLGAAAAVLDRSMETGKRAARCHQPRDEAQRRPGALLGAAAAGVGQAAGWPALLLRVAVQRQKTAAS